MNSVTYSFDLFDTCFVRACGFPKNVFDLLAYRTLGENCDESMLADFALIRVKGEQTARNLSDKEEVSLMDIYQYCSFKGLTSLSNEAIAEIEMEVEREQLCSVRSIWERINYLHDRGENIYYISDMYLPASFLKDLLVTHGFWKGGDRLYVSSTYGVTKRSGNLYKLIADENQLTFSRWYHCGDNRHSDYKMPQQWGIRVELIKHKFSVYECCLLRPDIFPGLFVSQHMAAISKAVRLSLQDDVVNDFASDLIAPLYVPFVFSILSDASKRGINRIFFLARDGYILHVIAKRLSKQFPKLELDYLYVSRASLYFPGIREVTTDNLECFFQTYYQMIAVTSSLRDVLSEFICDDVCDRLVDTLPMVGQCGRAREAFEVLLHSEEAIKILQTYHDEQRALILAYFGEKGLADENASTAIVDVRGTRHCHQVINTILQDAGYPPTFGYYLEVADDRKNITEAGSYQALLYKERMLKSQRLKYIVELRNVFEQYFSAAPTARTICYMWKEGKVRPMFTREVVPAETLELVRKHELVMMIYADLFMNNYLYKQIESVLLRSLDVLGKFAGSPSAHYLKALVGRRVGCMNNNNRYIIKKITWRDFGQYRIDWWRGAFFYTFRFPFSRRIVDFMYRIKNKLKNYDVYK